MGAWCCNHLNTNLSFFIILLCQQECEELARRVTDLNNENSALRVELENLQKLCGELEAENKSITVSGFIIGSVYLNKTVILPVDLE